MNSGVARDTVVDTDVQTVPSEMVLSVRRVFEKKYDVYTVNSTPREEKPGLNVSAYALGIEADTEFTRKDCKVWRSHFGELLC